MSNIGMRGFKPEDKSFIYATWLRGLYHGSDWFSQIDKKSFFDNYSRVLDLILGQQGTQVRVAHDPEDADVIYGYIVLGAGVIHYCFVKEPWRAKGIAKMLHGAHPTEAVTHITKPGNAIRKKCHWTFDPFKI